MLCHMTHKTYTAFYTSQVIAFFTGFITTSFQPAFSHKNILSTRLSHFWFIWTVYGGCPKTRAYLSTVKWTVTESLSSAAAPRLTLVINFCYNANKIKLPPGYSRCCNVSIIIYGLDGRYIAGFERNKYVRASAKFQTFMNAMRMA